MATTALRCFRPCSFDSADDIGRALQDLSGVQQFAVEIFARRIIVTYGAPTCLAEVRQALASAGFPCAVP